MGADFVGYGLAIEFDKGPNWITITPDSPFITAFRENENSCCDKFTTDAEIVDLLNTAIEAVKDGWEGNRRDAGGFSFQKFKVRVLITGGETWGDSPSDLFDSIDTLFHAVGLLDEMGFDY